MRKLAVVLALIVSLTSLPFARQVLADQSSVANAAFLKRDYVTAFRLYKKLAERGNASAQTYLGIMYDQGYGVPQNKLEAAKWYRKAAEQGYFTAQHNLGIMYERGLGIPQDYVLAYMWFNIAASGFRTSEGYVGYVINRDRVASKMTPDQITEAQRLAREWMQKMER